MLKYFRLLRFCGIKIEYLPNVCGILKVFAGRREYKRRLANFMKKNILAVIMTVMGSGAFRAGGDPGVGG